MSFTKYWCPKSWKVPQRKKSWPRWARELNIFPALFVRVNRPITRCDVWQFVTQVTKLKVCCKNQNSGVLCATLCHNLQDENLLSHKLSAQVVIRTITLCNLQFGKINITRKSKMFLWVVCFVPKKSEMALPVTSGFPQGNCYWVSINDLAAIIEDSLLSQYSDGACFLK